MPYRRAPKGGGGVSANGAPAVALTVLSGALTVLEPQRTPGFAECGDGSCSGVDRVSERPAGGSS